MSRTCEVQTDVSRTRDGCILSNKRDSVKFNILCTSQIKLAIFQLFHFAGGGGLQVQAPFSLLTFARAILMWLVKYISNRTSILGAHPRGCYMLVPTINLTVAVEALKCHGQWKATFIVTTVLQWRFSHGKTLRRITSYVICYDGDGVTTYFDSFEIVKLSKIVVKNLVNMRSYSDWMASTEILECLVSCVFQWCMGVWYSKLVLFQFSHRRRAFGYLSGVTNVSWNLTWTNVQVLSVQLSFKTIGSL